jgi:hypothetical protein
MASRSSAMVRRITISVWRTFLASAGYGMRFAVRRCAREAVTMVGDPAVDHVLDEPDAGDAVDQKRQPGAQGDRPCSVPRLGTAVDGAGRVQPPHGFQQPIMGNPKALGHTHALQWFGLDIARPVVPDQEIARGCTSRRPRRRTELRSYLHCSPRRQISHCPACRYDGRHPQHRLTRIQRRPFHRRVGPRTGHLGLLRCQ